MKTKKHCFQSILLCASMFAAAPCRAQTTVTQIATGGQHSLFVKSDGSLWAMGYNYYGQLGDGTGSISTNQPEMIVPGGVTAVAARGNHSFYQIGSALWAMGDNQYGQLGDGTTNNIVTPKQITGLIGISAGYQHSLYLRSTGINRDLNAMGDNEFGQLGDGSYINHSTPERIERDSTIVFGDNYVATVASGGSHSLFIKSDGSLWAMGYNGSGALGETTTDGGLYKTNKAEKILTGGVTAIGAGYSHSLFLKNDGSLWGMGDNVYGQLGSPNVRTGVVNGFTNQPVMITTNGVTAISAGFYDSFFIKTDGSLWAMGYNGYGELGDGTFNEAHLPEQIVAGSVTAVSAGDGHSLFLLSDGSLWGMGESFVGQLGPNYTTDQLRPVQIIGPIVANGGFESHDFLGWSLVGDTNWNHVVPDSNPLQPGAWGAGLGSKGNSGHLSQTLATIPGTNYLLSFWLGNVEGNGQPTYSEFSASWNGTNILSQTNIPLSAMQWTNFQFIVTATSTNTLLKFEVLQFHFGGLIPLVFDDVRVIPLSSPVITGINLTGTNLVLSATNGMWSGIYTMLSSTDFSQPVSQWTPVATNMLDGSGNFTITAPNPVFRSAPQQFYTLQLK